MTEATETQKNAYQQQWEAMSDRERHAVELTQLSWAFMDFFESGKSIAWIMERFAKGLGFTTSEVEFAIMAAFDARKRSLESVAAKIYSREGVISALAQFQTENAAIALEQLKSCPTSST